MVINEIISMLKEELSVKNKLIEEQQQTIRVLSESIKVANQNELAETIIDRKDIALIENSKKKTRSIWQFWKK
jgi:hypothetical protein